MKVVALSVRERTLIVMLIPIMSNISNVSFASNISIAKEIAETFEEWLVSISWLSVIIGTYLKYCCIKYVQSKPPGLQSMLDGIQLQMLWIWTLEDGMSAILNTPDLWTSILCCGLDNRLRNFYHLHHQSVPFDDLHGMSDWPYLLPGRGGIIFRR